MEEFAAESSTATEKLIAFESRYKGRHAGEHARESELDERKLHDKRVDEAYHDVLQTKEKPLIASADAGLSYVKTKVITRLRPLQRQVRRSFRLRGRQACVLGTRTLARTLRYS